MLVRYNTCLGSIDVQERNWLFKGLFSLLDVSLQIRKEGFYRKLLVFLISSKDFKPKYLATICLTLPNCLEMNWLFKGLFSLNDVSQIQYRLRKYQCSRKELVIQRLV